MQTDSDDESLCVEEEVDSIANEQHKLNVLCDEFDSFPSNLIFYYSADSLPQNFEAFCENLKELLKSNLKIELTDDILCGLYHFFKKEHEQLNIESLIKPVESITDKIIPNLQGIHFAFISY